MGRRHLAPRGKANLDEKLMFYTFVWSNDGLYVDHDGCTLPPRAAPYLPWPPQSCLRESTAAGHQLHEANQPYVSTDRSLLRPYDCLGLLRSASDARQAGTSSSAAGHLLGSPSPPKRFKWPDHARPRVTGFLKKTLTFKKEEESGSKESNTMQSLSLWPLRAHALHRHSFTSRDTRLVIELS